MSEYLVQADTSLAASTEKSPNQTRKRQGDREVESKNTGEE